MIYLSITCTILNKHTTAPISTNPLPPRNNPFPNLLCTLCHQSKGLNEKPIDEMRKLLTDVGAAKTAADKRVAGMWP